MAVFSITGESGSGKSAIVSQVLSLCPNAYPLTSITTRARRDSDLAGEYEYVTREAFLSMKEQGTFLWDVEHGDKLYGTRRKDVRAALESTARIGIMILVPSVLPILKDFLDDEGAAESDWLCCYIKPIEDEVIRARMLERGDTPRSIKRRMDAEAQWPWVMMKFLAHKKFHFIRNTGPLPFAVKNVLELMEAEI